MGKIALLKQEVIEKIAAGEVVERPASVVKELLENSIDSGASIIRVDFADFGKKLIKVTDNGSGIESDDIKLALKRHATSKIKDAADLENVATFGFRGEALSAISSVSEITITSKTKNQSSAIKVTARAGEIISKEETARQAGTTIEVKDLFFNTPARHKFLKSSQTEKNHIVAVFEELSLANPDIAFELYDNGSLIYNLPPTQNLMERISEILGAESAYGFMPIEIAHLFIKIYGFVTKPIYKENSRSKNYIFINKRPITSRMLNFAIAEAYKPYLPQGIHPISVLFLDINRELVDINVHPAKREIRLSKEREIFGVLKEAIQAAIQNSILPPLENLKSENNPPPDNDKPLNSAELRQKIAIEKSIYKYLSGQKDTLTSSNHYYTNNFSPSAGAAPRTAQAGVATQQSDYAVMEFNVKLNLVDAKLLGQFNKLYIAAEWGDNLIIVDQHAAQERVLYENYLKNAEQGSIETQELIIPYTFDVQQSEFEIIEKYAPEFLKLGIEIEKFGSSSFVIRSVPQIFGNISELKAFVSQILEQILFFDASSDRMPSSTPQIREKIIMASCKGAVKANQSLSKEEMYALLVSLSKCENPYTCPHGRPTLIKINSDELQKRFERK